VSITGILIDRSGNMKKTYSIHCDETDGKVTYLDDASTKSEADKIARNRFAKRLDRDSEVFVREEREILRLKSGKVGFRQEQ